MVLIITECWNDMLVTLPPLQMDEMNIALPAPKDVIRKILIKVKQPPNERLVEERVAKIDLSKESEYDRSPELTSSSSAETSPVRGLKVDASKPRKKIIDALSELSVYTRAYSFKDFDQIGRFLGTALL